MIKYIRLISILDRKVRWQASLLVVLCCVVGVLDFFTVLVSARLNFEKFDADEAFLVAQFFGAATLARIIFLFVNAYVCAKISAAASLFFVQEYVEANRSGSQEEDSSVASDVLAKTANLTTFVINPIFHLLIAVISLFGVIGSLVFSFPDLVGLFLFSGTVAVGLVWLLSLLSKRIGASLRNKQDKTSLNALDLINGASVVNRHPNKGAALKRFFGLDFRYKLTLSRLQAMAQAPKTTVDAIIALSLMALALLPSGQTDALVIAAPALAVSLVRVIPYMNSLGQALMTLRGYAPSVLDAITDVFEKRRVTYGSSLQDVGNLKYENFQDKDSDVIKASQIECVNKSQALTFSFGSKDKIFVHGISGSGKTSLLRCLTGELEPVSGFVHLPPLWEKHHVQLVTDDLPMFNGSLEFNLSLGGDIAITDSDLTKFGITLALDDQISFSTLSKSQRIRINLARALLAKPKVLLVDDFISQLPSDQRDELSRTLGSLEEGVLMVGSANNVPSGFTVLNIVSR
jgi:ABC-type multidrug transport system fused ATPase/permease subunit